MEFDRQAWLKLRENTALALTEEELHQMRGIGEQIDMKEVAEIYLPLSRLIYLQVKARRQLFEARDTFLGNDGEKHIVPFIIGVAGSVAVGKSTTSRVLQALLARWPGQPHVDLVTTDGFLYPNEVLQERNIMHRKGYPDSYDRRALMKFVSEIKAGVPNVTAPVYSHHTYNILPDQQVEVHQPDILILEGLNVLQTGPGLMVSDFFDFSIFVDARMDDIEQWYVNRFLTLRSTSFAQPDSHFYHYSSLTDEAATLAAREIWGSVNRPNLVENILPSRPRATLTLRKNSDHSIQSVRLRRL